MMQGCTLKVDALKKIILEGPQNITNRDGKEFFLWGYYPHNQS